MQALCAPYVIGSASAVALNGRSPLCSRFVNERHWLSRDSIWHARGVPNAGISAGIIHTSHDDTPVQGWRDM